MFGLWRIADHASLVAIDHRTDALHDIAKIVAEFGIVGCFEFLPREVAVVLCRDVASEEITKCIDTVIVDNLNRVNDIADCLAHFGTANIDESMDEQFFRKWEIKPKQHRWPNTSMKTQDVFANHLDISGPVFLPAITIRIPKHRDIVCECVEPDIHDLLGVVRDGHTPRKVLFGT